LEIKKLFLDSLQQVCEIFGLEHEDIYSNLNDFINNKEKFINKLHKSDKCIKENIGEVRTLLMKLEQEIENLWSNKLEGNVKYRDYSFYFILKELQVNDILSRDLILLIRRILCICNLLFMEKSRVINSLNLCRNLYQN